MTTKGSQARLTHADSAKIAAYCVAQDCTQYTLTELCKQTSLLLEKPVLTTTLKGILQGANITYKTAQAAPKHVDTSQLDRMEAKLDQLLALWGK